MSPKPSRALSLLILIVIMLFAAMSAAAQDAVTVDSVIANGNTVDVPVYVRDVSGTPLGRDQPAGSKIQAFTIAVNYAPAAAVQSVTFTRAGITAALTPAFEVSPSPSGSISLLAQFNESTNPIPFTLNANAPGDEVAHLVFTLSPSASPGSSIALTLDSSLTQLSNQGGSTSESGVALILVSGAINIPQLSLAIFPANGSVSVGNVTRFTAQASSNVISNTTVTLSSSDAGVASVFSPATIPAGSRAADFLVTGVAVGTASIIATLPASAGGASASAAVTVTAAPPLCITPSAPVIGGPATAESGKSYAITWPAVSDATDYVIDESTDVNFVAASSSTVTSTTASFTHTAANRYYYRVRARNLIAGCNTSSAFSLAISVLVSPAPVAQTRILPVVGSTPGSLGSFFKTAVQLFNVKSSTISGKIVFHTQATQGSPNDPSLAYSIAPGKTLAYADLLPAMGISSGLGSADLVADAGSAFPVTLVRVFNDAGIGGTTGLTFEPMATSEALQSGETGALIGPANANFRFNIGVRTLEQGASMTFTVRDKDGAVVKTATRTYSPTFFQQLASSLVLDGFVLTGGETITIQVTAGSAFVYGSMTDNTTQDPSVQFARKVE
jgi:hypothetical protein